MKLASLKEGRDGRLLVVSRDLGRAVEARTVAPTLQAALEDWGRAAPALDDLYRRLEAGHPSERPFDPGACAAPLPRAYQWLDGSAYLRHAELVLRRAYGAEVPADVERRPQMYQGASDAFLGPREPLRFSREAWGIDFEAEMAVVTDDVPMGVAAEQAAAHVMLLMLANDVSLRNLAPQELATGFGFVHSKPPTAFAPVAVTPDELGAAWAGGRPRLRMNVRLNGRPFGAMPTDAEMTFTFADLIAHAATTRRLSAGTVIGSGTVSCRAQGGAIEQGGCGYGCLAEPRTAAMLAGAETDPVLLRFGDRIEIELVDAAGESVCGRIDQRVERYRGPGHA